MCFKKPKPPKPTPQEQAAVQQATEERARQTQELREQRTMLKDERTEQRLRQLRTGYGRASLITGSRGGMGFQTPLARGLLSVGG